MQPTTGTDWRDKYAALLDEQEAQQKAFAQQQELLRRAVVRVSLAAEGYDTELDRSLTRLRAALKEEDARLDMAIEQVEASLLSYERQYESQQAEIQQALLTLIQQAQYQYEDQSRPLKELDQALKAQSRPEMAAVLQRLADIQGQAIAPISSSSEESGKSGFMDRLLRRNAVTSDERDTPINSTVSEQDIPSESVPETEVIEAEPLVADGVVEGQLQTRAEAEAADQKEAVLQRPVFEPAFSRVSDKVYRVLKELLDSVEPVGCTVQKAQAARQRMEKGLNWYELVPTLEDIRDLVLQAYLMADEEYRTYLQQIHGVLSEILTELEGSVSAHEAWESEENAFTETLNQQLGSLGRSVAVATEVSSLKQEIHSHLSVIQEALQRRQKASAQVSGEGKGEQLNRLLNKVRQVEREAADARDALASAREKALTDTLTGLPNREAYNERGHLEWKRWQRYQHPLTLVVCDIDHFKQINDSYGHQTGDRVLQVLSKALRGRLRSVDFIARYGGEEFVMLLPDTRLEDGLQLLDKIRAVIAGTPFRFKDEPVQVTLSAGLVMLKGEETLDAAFARADKLLYQAKESGRNRCLG
ncbi:diguanylate cyclase [Aestuariicella sp. G3-2]|uniref:GGDEF domain-containing protein n=1 Tax=Pseudomaricurvus albidus TaxID=2842452 RepID=UPI001C0CD9A8|nr:GGDEF domain-containing protein [Aestuariicella albida]MBU3068740.1 diguanylate cyclase [Aestuariicella albida]